MDQNNERYKKVKERVGRLRSFYSNLIIFAVVMAVLVLFNLWKEPENMWSLWIGLIWGIVLIIQAFSLFTIRDSFLGSDWEEKTIKKMMDKDQEDKK